MTSHAPINPNDLTQRQIAYLPVGQRLAHRGRSYQYHGGRFTIGGDRAGDYLSFQVFKEGGGLTEIKVRPALPGEETIDATTV